MAYKSHPKIKLTCPVCNVDFISKTNQQIYCDYPCRKKNADIKKKISENKSKQEMASNPNFEYDLQADVFKIKGWIK